MGWENFTLTSLDRRLHCRASLFDGHFHLFVGSTRAGNTFLWNLKEIDITWNREVGDCEDAEKKGTSYFT